MYIGVNIKKKKKKKVRRGTKIKNTGQYTGIM